MTHQERQTLIRLFDAIESVVGIRNPKDLPGHITYYLDMSEVRCYLRRILSALLDRDPAYKKENQRTIADELQALEAFIALRKSQDWGRPENGISPWKGSHYA